MYEMAPVQLSWRRTYVNVTEAMADAMSSQRHIDKLFAPIIVTYGAFETPDFQRQSRDFAAALSQGEPLGPPASSAGQGLPPPGRRVHSRLRRSCWQTPG
jgi:hypothetical protein